MPLSDLEILALAHATCELVMDHGSGPNTMPDQAAVEKRFLADFREICPDLKPEPSGEPPE